MYKIKLKSANENKQTIRKIRKEICRSIGLDVNGLAIEPLDFASYFFGYVCPQQEPVALVEFFMYEQAFISYEDAPYSQATNLEKIAPLNQMGHIRSFFLERPYRKSKLFLLLIATTVKVASQMGAHYITAGTGIDNKEILLLHRNAGMKALGKFMVDNSIQQLSLLELDPLLNRANALVDKYSIDIGLERINYLKQLRKNI